MDEGPQVGSHEQDESEDESANFICLKIFLGNESQRNAAMLAAAAVRAAAAASTRGRGAFPMPNSGGANTYPFGLRGYPPNLDQMPSPYPSSQGMQSPEYGGVMSPSNEATPSSSTQSPIPGKSTPQNGAPSPYSPMSKCDDRASSPCGGKMIY